MTPGGHLGGGKQMFRNVTKDVQKASGKKEKNARDVKLMMKTLSPFMNNVKKQQWLDYKRT